MNEQKKPYELQLSCCARRPVATAKLREHVAGVPVWVLFHHLLPLILHEIQVRRGLGRVAAELCVANPVPPSLLLKGPLLRLVHHTPFLGAAPTEVLNIPFEIVAHVAKESGERIGWASWELLIAVVRSGPRLFPAPLGRVGVLTIRGAAAWLHIRLTRLSLIRHRSPQFGRNMLPQRDLYQLPRYMEKISNFVSCSSN